MKRDSFSQALGLTQHEIATLLEVSRSTWSMYVLGEREIPMSKLSLLHDMKAYVEAAVAQTESKNSQQPEWRGIEKHIEKCRDEIAFEQRKSAHHSANRSKNHDRAARRALSQTFLDSFGKTKENQRFAVVAAVSKPKRNENLTAQFDQAFKEATLEFQLRWLEDHLKRS